MTTATMSGAVADVNETIVAGGETYVEPAGGEETGGDEGTGEGSTEEGGEGDEEPPTAEVKPKKEKKAPKEKAPKTPRVKKEKVTTRENCPVARRLPTEGIRNSVKGAFESTWTIEGMPGVYAYHQGIRADYVAQEGDVIAAVLPEKGEGSTSYVKFVRDVNFENVVRTVLGL